MTYVVIVECDVCGRDLERSMSRYPTREAAEAALASYSSRAVENAPRCRNLIHREPYDYPNPTRSLLVIEGEPAA
jgi:hypothetical protein